MTLPNRAEGLVAVKILHIGQSDEQGICEAAKARRRVTAISPDLTDHMRLIDKGAGNFRFALIGKLRLGEEVRRANGAEFARQRLRGDTKIGLHQTLHLPPRII